MNSLQGSGIGDEGSEFADSPTHRVPEVPILGSGNPRTSNGYGHNLSPTIFFKAFLGLFLRDLRVLSREFLPFLLRVGMQPLLFLFVFTFILPRMGAGNPMAVAAAWTSAPSCFLALWPWLSCSPASPPSPCRSPEFGITREIDDRVMCPLPLWAVALEKVCFSAMQSIIAALLVIPMAVLHSRQSCRRADVSQLVPAGTGPAACQPAGRRPRAWSSAPRSTQNRSAWYFHPRSTHHLPGLRLLPLDGPLQSHSLALDRRTLQPHCLYERRPPRRRHSRYRTYALVGHPDRSRFLRRRARTMGTQRLSRQSAILADSFLINEIPVGFVISHPPADPAEGSLQFELATQRIILFLVASEIPGVAALLRIFLIRF